MYVFSLLAILCLLYFLIVYDESTSVYETKTTKTTKVNPFQKNFTIKINSLYLCVNNLTNYLYLSDNINESEFFQMKLCAKKVILKSLSLKKYLNVKLTSRINQQSDVVIEAVNKKDISCHLDLRKVPNLGTEVSFFNGQKLSIDNNGLLYAGNYGSKVAYLRINRT